MPQVDRHRERIVPIEFESHETFSALPLDERVTLVLITSGHACFILNNEPVTLNAPCIMLLSCYDTINLVDQNRLSAKSFSFYPCFMNSSLTFEALSENKFTEMEDEHDRNLISMFLRRDDVYKGYLDIPPKTYLRLSEWLAIIGTETASQSDGYWTCRIRRYLLQSLYLIEDIYMEQINKSKQKINKAPVNLVLEYIHTNYPNEISLKGICNLVHMDRTTLTNKFKLQVGRTVMDYLLYYRIKIACEALSHTNLSLAEISEAVGFKYDTHFIKQFTAKQGMTPTEYRHSEWDRKT